MGAPWNTKDANSVAMPPEIKSAVEGLMRDWEAFKSKSDAETAELKKRGSADVVTREELKRINAGLDEAKDSINQLFKKAARPSVSMPAEQVAVETKANAAFASV